MNYKLAQGVLDTYLDDFTNYNEGATINGVKYWSVTQGSADNAITQSGVTPAGTGKSLELIAAATPALAERSYSYGGLTPTWISFQVRPSASGQTPSVPSTGIAAVVCDYTGKILASDGTSWVDTGLTYTIGQWYTVTLKLNFQNHSYDLYYTYTLTPDVVFVPVKTNLGFIDPSVNSLSNISFCGSYSTTQSSNVYVDNILISYIDRFEIITPPQKIMGGQVSDAMIVQLQDSTSSPQTAVTDITLDLKSTSPKGRFSLTRSPWQDVAQVILPKDAQTLTFYYKDDIIGKPLINVAEYPDYGYTDALQQEDIVAILSFFDITCDVKQTAGQNFKLKITANDEFGGLNENYGGTIKLSINYLSPTGGFSKLTPEEVSGFVRGALEIDAFYPDCGIISITVTDSQDSAKAGTSSQILFLPASFTLNAATDQVASRPFDLTVTAKNAQNATTPNYNGGVNLSSVAVSSHDISKAVLSPATVPGTGFQKGLANISAVYNLYGTMKIKAVDSTDNTRTGLSNEIKFLPKKISVTVVKPAGGRDFFYIGEPVGITIKIEDDAGNPIPNYTDTATFASSPGLAVQSQYTFTKDDAGQRTILAVPSQVGIYTVIAQAEGGFKAETPKITIKNATIEVIDTTSPIGTGEVIIQIVDDEGKVITSENNLVVGVKAVEDLDNQTVSLPASTVTLTEGRGIIPVSNTEAEIVTIIPSSLYKINVKKGTITFGQAGKMGINPLMWREIKGKK